VPDPKRLAKRPRDLGTLWVLLGAIFGGLAAFLTAGIFISPTPLLKGAWLLCTLLAIAATVLKATNESRLKKWANQEAGDAVSDRDDEQRRVRILLGGALKAVSGSLDELAAMAPVRRRTEISGFREKVAVTACELVTATTPRSAYFRVENRDTSPRIMSRAAQHAIGRTDESTSRFVEGDGHNQNVWDLIDRADDAELIDDLKAWKPPGFDAKNRAYRCYISAPVRAGRRAYGMLTVNTIAPGGLTDVDKLMVLLLARLLATAEAIVDEEGAVVPGIQHNVTPSA
jgi:hypothetical protein